VCSSDLSVDQYVANAGFVRFADIVRASGKSSNTVRHQFQTGNGGFRDTRQKALVKAATSRLRESKDSVEEIAAGLGYSDGRSFRRFLKNATGLTPQEIRRGQPQEMSSDDILATQKLFAMLDKLSI
jgi:AraC-like DNA-binding protein